MESDQGDGYEETKRMRVSAIQIQKYSEKHSVSTLHACGQQNPATHTSEANDGKHLNDYSNLQHKANRAPPNRPTRHLRFSGDRPKVLTRTAPQNTCTSGPVDPQRRCSLVARTPRAIPRLPDRTQPSPGLRNSDNGSPLLCRCLFTQDLPSKTPHE